MKKDIRTLAALLIASATFVACSSDDNIANETQQPANGKYTLTINASKSDRANTRALDLSGKTLTASWATTENVYVQKSEEWASGSLKPQANGSEATLKGTLTNITIAKNDVLTLQFPRSGARDYTGQVGTLADIAAKYDYATATVEVEGVSGTGNIIPKSETTAFASQQAIVKFTLIDKADGTTPLSATQLVVNDGTTDYTIIPDPAFAAPNELFVAIPGFSDKTVTLNATVDGNTYTYERSGVTFTNGKYYEITVKMAKSAVDLSTLTGNYTAQDGDVLTGTTSYTVTIPNGATVTLDGVNISTSNHCIKCAGSATIILADGSTNTLTNTSDQELTALSAGDAGTTLTIKGSTGILNVTGSTHVAAIGGSLTNTYQTSGNIEIQGGVITATGGNGGAGIGGDYKGSCGSITISGGTVNATGGNGGAGIGSGDDSSCGHITISGGTVNATGGDGAPGIGNRSEECGNITITNQVTIVTATKGSGCPNSVGPGEYGNTGNVTIGGKKYWDGSDYCNGGETVITVSPYTYTPTPPVSGVLSFDVDGIEFYYDEGDTFAEAISKYPELNVGWQIDGDGFIELKEGGYYLGNDDGDSVEGSHTIDPSDGYYWY